MLDNVNKKMKDIVGGAQGRYKIQLFDANTNELIEETDWNNMINPNIALFGHPFFYINMPFTGEHDMKRIFPPTGLSNYTNGFASVLSLVNTTETPESVKHRFPKGDVTCTTDLFQTSSSDIETKANVNLGESYNRIEKSEDGTMIYRRHIVIDYATNQGNGTFNSIVVAYADRDMFIQHRATVPESASYNYYSDKPIGKLPVFQINKENFGTSESGSSDCGPISVEAPGVFWMCNTYGGFKKTSSSTESTYNWDELTFNKFDVSDGTIKHIETVKLTGTPEAEKNHISETYDEAFIGVYMGGKFYVGCTSNRTATRNGIFVYNRQGVYEKTIPLASPYTGYFNDNMYCLCALPGCVIEKRYDSYALNIYGPDYSELLRMNSTQFRAKMVECYNAVYPNSPVSSLSLEDMLVVPFTDENNKVKAMFCTDNNVNSEIAYYDPETNKIYPINTSKYWSLANTGGYKYNSKYVHKNQEYTLFIDYMKLAGSTPWWSWCKLPKSVTKTSSTTMKIQYDITCDVLAPFSPALSLV